MLDNEPLVVSFEIDPGTPPRYQDYVSWEDQIQEWLDTLPPGRSLFFISPHPRDNSRVWAVLVKTKE